LSGAKTLAFLLLKSLSNGRRETKAARKLTPLEIQKRLAWTCWLLDLGINNFFHKEESSN
jgi:hypothetical protein